MASVLCLLFVLLPLFPSVRSDDTSEKLLKGINAYRTSLNLPSLTENDNAECLADQLANQFKGQPCTNTTGANTVPGTEPQFPNFPGFLNRCRLNATVTRDAAIMPACVPDLNQDLVLSNFTKSQYSGSLNDSKFVAAGIADEGDWVVVILTTNTSTGSFSPATGTSSARSLRVFSYVMGLFFVLLIWAY